MSQVRLTVEAEADLDAIRVYTEQAWGPDQARRYILDLKDAFVTLTSSPRMGRPCNTIRAGLRRVERASHVIFYSEGPTGILVSRILHRSMLPGSRSFPT